MGLVHWGGGTGHHEIWYIPVIEAWNIHMVVLLNIGFIHSSLHPRLKAAVSWLMPILCSGSGRSYDWRNHLYMWCNHCTPTCVLAVLHRLLHASMMHNFKTSFPMNGSWFCNLESGLATMMLWVVRLHDLHHTMFFFSWHASSSNVGSPTCFQILSSSMHT